MLATQRFASSQAVAEQAAKDKGKYVGIDARATANSSKQQPKSVETVGYNMSPRRAVCSILRSLQASSLFFCMHRLLKTEPLTWVFTIFGAIAVVLLGYWALLLCASRALDPGGRQFPAANCAPQAFPLARSHAFPPWAVSRYQLYAASFAVAMAVLLSSRLFAWDECRPRRYHPRIHETSG